MFTFTKDCLIGVAEIDDEHKRLFELIGEIDSAVKSNTDSVSTAMALLNELKQYAVTHFAHEEAYMESINYKNMFIQKVQHDKFREKINDMNLEHLDENTEDTLSDILTYLTNWLVNHILEHDKQIGQ